MRSALLSFALGMTIVAAAGCRTSNGTYQGTRDRSQTLDADTGGGGAGPATFPIKPTSEMNVVATIPSSGDWMCFGFGSLWEPGGGGITRVDPTTHQVITKIAAAKGNFCYAAPDSNTMWVASVFNGKLSKIDADTNTVTGSYDVAITSGSEASFAVSAGGVWVVTSRGNTQSGTLTRVDPGDGHVIADITIPDGSAGIVASDKYIWVSNPDANSVTQVDPANNTVVKKIAVDAGPRFIAYGEGGVWAMCQGTGRVARIDPDSGALVTHIDAKNPGFGGDIAAGEGGVFVTTFGKPVTHMDPKTNTVVEAFQGSGYGDAIRTGGGFVWVSGGQLHQIKIDTGTSSNNGGGMTADPLAPPAGATAADATIAECSGQVSVCSQLAAPSQLGCVASNGTQTFKAMGGQNNSCALIGLNKQICDASLTPASFKAVCFTKQ